MVTERKPPHPVNQSRPSEAPLLDPGVRRQLGLLFGESLFGPWPELAQHSIAPLPRRKWKRWVVKLCALLLLAASVLGIRSLVRPAFKRQLDDQRGHYAEELKSFIDDGNLERASQFLKMVQVPATAQASSKLDAHDPYLDIIVATEAALYRYYDAAPERLQRIRPFLDDSGRAAPARQIAFLVVASREERAAKLSELERLRNDLPNHNELAYLLATALEYRGEVAASRKAWEQAAQLEPAWLGHRLEQAWFEARHNENASAQQVASQIVHLGPDSSWAQLVLRQFELPAAVASAIGTDAGTAVATPVQVYFERLMHSLQAANFNRFSEAQSLLRESAAAIQYQAPFLFDAFDWCLDEDLPALARVLTQLPEWPSATPVARAKQARLAIALANEYEDRAAAPANRSSAPGATSAQVTSKQKKGATAVVPSNARP